MTLENQGNIPAGFCLCMGGGVGGAGSDLAEGTGKVCFSWFYAVGLDAYKAIADSNTSVFANPMNYT